MNKQKQHIIFDLDGTLIDSRDEILKTYRIVFENVPPAKEPDVANLNYGLTLHDLLVSVYGDDGAKISAARQQFIAIYDKSEYEETHLYEGVFDILHALKNEGYELYIATNKRLLPTTRILEAKKIAHLFSCIMANEMQAGITLSKRQMIAALKEKGAFSQGYMVGDATTDVQAGIDEKLVTIAINYGYETPEALAALNPAYGANNFQNLYTFVVEDSKH